MEKWRDGISNLARQLYLSVERYTYLLQEVT